MSIDTAKPTITSRRFFIGLDLGQANDPTAITVLEHVVQRTEWPDYKMLHEYQLRYAKRYPLGTSYPDIVDAAKAVFQNRQLQLSTHLPTTMVIDLTGVGRPVLDMFRKAGLDPLAINITGGNTTSSGQDPKILNVPKRDLATTLQVLLQSGMLKFAHNLGELATLKKELQNFKVKVSASGQDAYEAWRSGDHDDLVLSTALACWVAHHGDEGGAPVRPVQTLEVKPGNWRGRV